MTRWGFWLCLAPLEYVEAAPSLYPAPASLPGHRGREKDLEQCCPGLSMGPLDAPCPLKRGQGQVGSSALQAPAPSSSCLHGAGNGSSFVFTLVRSALDTRILIVGPICSQGHILLGAADACQGPSLGIAISNWTRGVWKRGKAQS